MYIEHLRIYFNIFRQKRLNEHAVNKMSNCSYFMVGEGKMHNDVAWNNLTFENKLKEFFQKALTS